MHFKCNGQATCTITDVLGGTYSATADYSGDGTYAPGERLSDKAIAEEEGWIHLPDEDFLDAPFR